MQSKVTVIPITNVGEYAWRVLRRYRNEEYVSRTIIQNFDIPKGHHPNARKQASQIGKCITQAGEYYTASQRASLATRPVQLYYCAMSLALADMLMRSDGNYALDKIRHHHNHHGLVAVLPEKGPVVLDQLAAKPLDGKGTFYLWHRIAREGSLAGKSTTRYDANAQTGSAIMLRGANQKMKDLPDKGISLEDLYLNLPSMITPMAQLGKLSSLVRSTLTLESSIDRQDELLKIIVHPTPASVLESLLSNISVPPEDVPYIDCQELHSGAIIKSTFFKQFAERSINFPSGITVSIGNTYFMPKVPSLNEFGLYYVGLYILGMFCRYYPDIWMNEVERHTDFAMLAEAFLDAALERLPLSSASAFSEECYIYEM